MGICGSGLRDDGEMSGVGRYQNLNPYLAKKQSAEFRMRIEQVLSAITLQGLGGDVKNAVGLCEVVKSGEDNHGQPLEITQQDLKDVAAVLRVFAEAVQNEIVGACLLARPRDYAYYQYDYSKSAVVTLRAGHQVVSAAVCTLRIIDSTTRCLEVSWVATLRKHRGRGYATTLFGYVQQIAAVMGISAIIVLSSRTSVGYWLNQPRPSEARKLIMIRSPHSSRRLTKGYSKMPHKYAKLKAGLKRSHQHEEPPPEVKQYYSDRSPFRFDHSKSVHIWYIQPLHQVDYLSLSARGILKCPSLASSSSSSRQGRHSKGRQQRKGRGADRAAASGSATAATIRHSTSSPALGKAGRGGSGGGATAGSSVRRSSSFSGKHSPYQVQRISQIASAKKMAHRLREKQRRAKAGTAGGTSSSTLGRSGVAGTSDSSGRRKSGSGSKYRVRGSASVPQTD